MGTVVLDSVSGAPVYGSNEEIEGALRSYGLVSPARDAVTGEWEDAGFAMKLLSASRFVDNLRFHDDDVGRVGYRWESGEVPDAVVVAVGLLALRVDDSAVVGAPSRSLGRVSLGGLSFDYDDKGEPASSDDERDAARLGISDVRAYKVLRSFLVRDEAYGTEDRGGAGIGAYHGVGSPIGGWGDVKVDGSW